MLQIGQLATACAKHLLTWQDAVALSIQDLPVMLRQTMYWAHELSASISTFIVHFYQFDGVASLASPVAVHEPLETYVNNPGGRSFWFLFLTASGPVGLVWDMADGAGDAWDAAGRAKQ